MEIIKHKRKGCICKRCNKRINSLYKVLIVNYKTKNYYHLSCYFSYLKMRLETTKKQLKKFSYRKYKRVMILEVLE